ncbi:MAG: protein kinase, partial [Candidatus Krumholzibacteriia bacterium]
MIGEQIGPYEVTGSLGRGGMGEVYRARDTRLDRDVALKILPPEFAGDQERLSRFQREARLLAALQHQNIAAIYGLEELEGHPVLVMELAEGDDLAVRLGGGALPPDEVQRIAAQLAAGLEYAHEQGVVHRDLKPANIKVAQGGRVKILDFGLARALEGPRGASSTTAAAVDDTVTRTRDLTGVGAVLGTAAYMSPEQTRGYAVDRRADIWAFGVVVFEMLTGQRLFAGETASDTLAAVLRKDPDWRLIPADTPPVLAQLCRRCLEKDPQLRLRDIGEARIALEGTSSSMMSMRTELLGPPAAAPAVGLRTRLPLAVALAAVLAALVVGWLGLSGSLGPRPAPPRLVRATVMLDAGQGLYLNPGNPGPPVVSPDGRRLAFVVQDTSGAVTLGVRALDGEAVKLIPGTAGAAYPFWSPDSRRVGYFASGKLNTVDVAGGGPVVPVCDTENAKGGSWGAGNLILYTPSHSAGIFMVDAAGGEPVAVTDPDQDERFRSHRFPEWLPDGKHFIYLAWQRAAAGGANTADASLRVGSIDGSLDKELMPAQTGARYAAGHLTYVHEGVLMARPFDPGALAFNGPPRPLVGDVLAIGAAHCGAFALTEAGVLCFVGQGSAMGVSRLAWVDDQQREVVVDRVPGLLGFSVSPDGARIAMSKVDEQLGSYDIW